MKRVFHHYQKWEDYPAGFYENCSGDKKQEYILKVIEMFESEQLTKQYMNLVIQKWTYSCQHNLTNESMNRIAYIGQAACCLYANIPSTITMEAWSLLSETVQNRSNKIAEEILNNWINQNKNIQLCLNID